MNVMWGMAADLQYLGHQGFLSPAKTALKNQPLSWLLGMLTTRCRCGSRFLQNTGKMRCGGSKGTAGLLIPSLLLHAALPLVVQCRACAVVEMSSGCFTALRRLLPCLNLALEGKIPLFARLNQLSSCFTFSRIISLLGKLHL